MNPEKQTSSSELTRKQKLARRFAPVALLAAGAATFGAVEHSGPDEHDKREAVAEATAMVHTESMVKFGGSESGWGHGAAEKAIHVAVKEGLTKVGVMTDDVSSEKLDIEKVVSELPVYEQAELVLEMAGYENVSPDEGDVLVVGVDVTLDTEDGVSYEVTDAHIEDLHNNQS